MAGSKLRLARRLRGLGLGKGACGRFLEVSWAFPVFYSRRLNGKGFHLNFEAVLSRIFPKTVTAILLTLGLFRRG